MRLRAPWGLVAAAGLLMLANAAHAQSFSPSRQVPLPPSARGAMLRPAPGTAASGTAASGTAAPVAAASVALLDSSRGAASDPSLLEPAPSFSPERFWYGVGSAAALDAVFTVGLASIWYDESERTSFHFYSESDNVVGPGGTDDGWLDDWYTYAQQDKLGHVWTAWQIARITGGYGRWAGLSPKKAGLFGGIIGVAFQMQIEVSDGFSKAYGFSRTDALANVVGSTLGGLKVAYPKRLDWFSAKYSYNPSPYYGTKTTEVDGSGPLGYLGNAIKDYDGITYWITVRPEELLEGRARRVWPDWLALSAGYGADGLAHPISGHHYKDSPPDDDRPAGYAPYEHRREFYIAPDIDLLHSLDLPQPFQAIARFFEFVRLPAPALQLAPEVEWHWVFY